MAKGAIFDNDLLQLIFNGTSIANLADNAATSPLTSLYVSLHTADPTATGEQTSSEIGYAGYGRVALARSPTAPAWTVTGNSVSPVGNISFVAGTGGGGVATNFAVGTALSGTGKILYTGSITPPITCGLGITPILTTSSIISES